MVVAGVLVLLHLQSFVLWVPSVHGSLKQELSRAQDLSEWNRITSEYKLLQYYMDDSEAKITCFAPVDDVFLRWPNTRSMRQNEGLSHIADTKITEIASNGRWMKADNNSMGHTLVKRTARGGRVYIRQFEHNPGNFSYFANNGRICNHVSTSWYIVSGQQLLYKICSWYGHEPYPGTALDFIKDDITDFDNRFYNNRDLSMLKQQIYYDPSIPTIVYGSSAWNDFHTFFLPNDDAFRRVPSQTQIHREVLLAHVTMPGVVLFTESWLYDYGVHYYSTVRLDSNFVRENYRLKLAIRNITEYDTGRWSVYAVSQVYEQFSSFRRGAVWAKIVEPNIPVSNGVVHIVNAVLGVITQSIEQILDNDDDKRFTELMLHVREVGQIVLSHLSAHQGSITFFAPTNEAFRRIPEDVKKRLLRDKLWLTQVLRLHIVPGKELTTAEINNHTIVNTLDTFRQIFFLKGEWPKNNITFYVNGGGTRATIRQEDMACTNGIVQIIDRVLGVPYLTMFEFLRNETTLQMTYMGVRETNLRYTLDPWEIVRPEQNFTFFVPTDEAWFKVPALIRNKFYDGAHWRALQFVLKRHIIQGQALTLFDLRERSFVMMNNQRVVVRRRGRWWQLYWPYGNVVAQVVEGGELAARNGFMHKIDNVLVLEEDLKANILRSAPLASIVILMCTMILLVRLS